MTTSWERPITRRRFVGVTMGMLSAGGLLAACGGDDEEAAPATTAAGTGGETAQTATAAAGELPRGGTLVHSTASPPYGFDPARWWYSTTWAGAYVTHDRLVEITRDGTGVEPGLAELPEVNADGTLYTFRLRDATFSDGSPVTAADVKFSLERLVAPATGAEGAGLYTGLTIPGMADVLNESANELSGITVVDDKTLTVELEQADSVFLYILGLPFGSIVPRAVVEELGLEAYNWNPVGSGPYVMKDIVQDKGVVLERRPDQWQDVGFVDRVEWTFGVDPELAVLRIQDGQQDTMEEGIPSGSLAPLRDNPDTAEQVHIGTENNVLYFTMSLEQEALADLRVRQAIAMAVDKERYARAISGLGEVANGGLFSPLSPYYQDGIAYPFDPEGAKALLAEAGYPDGFDLLFNGANYTPWIEMGQTVQQDLEQIGIRLDVKALTREGWGNEGAKHPVGLHQNQWELPYPHGSYVMDAAFGSPYAEHGQCCNWSNLRDDRVDELIAQAHAATDEAEIVDTYKEIDRIVIQEQALWVPMVYPKVAMLVSDRVRGYEIPPSPIGIQKFFARYGVEEG